MPWHDSDEDLEEFEDPDQDDSDDETTPCPYCQEPIYDDAERCPHCGRYLSREDAPRRLPVWFAVGFLLSMLVLLGWVLWWR